MKRTPDKSRADPLDGSPAAGRLSALADPLRLRITRLLERRELTVGELAKVLQTPQSTMSRNLKTLLHAGWLSRRAEGAATLYQLVLDDLPQPAREVWVAVRGQCGSSAQIKQDDRRLEAVLAERRLDSRSFFGRVAGEWDDVRGDLFGRGFTPVALLALLDPSWIVADLGCGTGNAAEHLAPFVQRVIAVDQSEPMLGAARKRLTSFNNIDFRAGDLEALPIEDASVDAVVIVLVLHHLEEPAAALAEVRRITKPGGVALIVDMLAHEHDEYRRTMGHKHLGFDADAMRTLLRAAGLTDIRTVPLPSSPDARGPGLQVTTGRRPTNGR